MVGGAPGFVSVQNQYNILHREPEDGVLGECERIGLAFLPFFPLASGVLTGKYTAAVYLESQSDPFDENPNSNAPIATGGGAVTATRVKPDDGP